MIHPALLPQYVHPGCKTYYASSADRLRLKLVLIARVWMHSLLRQGIGLAVWCGCNGLPAGQQSDLRMEAQTFSSSSGQSRYMISSCTWQAQRMASARSLRGVQPEAALHYPQP